MHQTGWIGHLRDEKQHFFEAFVPRDRETMAPVTRNSDYRIYAGFRLMAAALLVLGIPTLQAQSGQTQSPTPAPAQTIPDPPPTAWPPAPNPADVPPETGKPPPPASPGEAAQQPDQER